MMSTPRPIRSWSAFSPTVAKPAGRPSTTATKVLVPRPGSSTGPFRFGSLASPVLQAQEDLVPQHVPQGREDGSPRAERQLDHRVEVVRPKRSDRDLRTCHCGARG